MPPKQFGQGGTQTNQGYQPSGLKTPLSNIPIDYDDVRSGSPFGIPLPDLNNLGTAIPPEVQALTEQLYQQGEKDIGRLVEALSLRFGGGDAYSSPRTRSQALLGGELGGELLSSILGIQAGSAETQRQRVFQERQMLIDSAIKKQLLGMQLTSEEAVALKQFQTQESIAAQQNATQRAIAELNASTARSGIASNERLGMAGLENQRTLQEMSGEQARAMQNLTFDQQLQMMQIQAQQQPASYLSALLGTPPTSVGTGSSSSGGGLSVGFSNPFQPIPFPGFG